VEKKSKKSMLLAASVAGLLTVVGAMANAGVVYADVHCAGVNGCKGQGECGGKGNSCAGKNACKGQGWVTQKTEAGCTTAGGTVIPAEKPAAAPVAAPAAS